MQIKIFNNIIMICMLTALGYSTYIWLSPNTGSFFDFRAAAALIMFPVVWIAGNFITTILVLRDNHHLVTPLFRFQCAVSAISIACFVFAYLLYVEQ